MAKNAVAERNSGSVQLDGESIGNCKKYEGSELQSSRATALAAMGDRKFSIKNGQQIEQGGGMCSVGTYLRFIGPPSWLLLSV